MSDQTQDKAADQATDQATATTEAAKPEKKNGKVSDAAIDSLVADVGKQLAKQKKVKVKLYLSQEERSKIEASQNAGKKVVWPFETVNINGYTFQIQRGKEVEVPESVYEVLSQANII